jgi:hypothetical protein
VSRKRERDCECEVCRAYRRYMETYPQRWNNSRLSLRYLVILILVILQFGQENRQLVKMREYYGRPQLIDNSILFIITLYFLSCCNTDC